MRFRTWIVAALGLGGLLLLIVVSMVASSRKAQEIYSQLDQLNTHHQNLEATLRRLRSDVNLSGIFVRDYLLDVARERAPEYRDQIAEFRRRNMTTLDELRSLIKRDEQEAMTNCVRHAHAENIAIEVTADRDLLHLSVSDDGVGLDPARRQKGL